MSTIDDYSHAMDMVKEVEQGPVSKFSAETRCFADLVRSVDKYHRDRLRSTAQILITETGADGPQNAEVVAADAVQLIKNLRVELCNTKAKLIAHEQDVRDAAGEFRIPVPAPRTETAGLLASAVLSRRRAQRYEEENLVLLREVDEWKDASGLERGGDPDGVTPDDLRNEIAHLRAAQEKSWSAADEALLAENDVERARMVLVVEQFCHHCVEGEEPGSCPDCPLEGIGGGKEKDSTRLTDEPVNSGLCNDGELGEKCDQS